MAIVTGILTTMEVLEQVSAVYSSKDPLLIRFRNQTEKKTFVLEYIGGLNNMSITTIPSPYVSPSAVADVVLGAGSWSEASVQVELRGKSGGKEMRLQLNYNWISETVSDLAVAVHHEGKVPDDSEKSAQRFDTNIKALRHSNWSEFDVMALSTGKLVEVMILEKGIM
ncbi:hypothetical protein ACFL2V_02915 [Pseudomonadota bacterium]